ncbi:hypothetical protein M011DRAFT_470645 [Sporormia fimetaria CBS 119925]|uniref:Uncharacterized protein n=1 Tax=Sporormia fimetaria CBS 119925 TaxID=1340428 RepID=A0A6A6V4V5_9PLEO|nr:hypothetical protein M011DRAFT_470645 [Sporormia fimetaria CBS 119925]
MRGPGPTAHSTCRTTRSLSPLTPEAPHQTLPSPQSITRACCGPPPVAQSPL